MVVPAELVGNGWLWLAGVSYMLYVVAAAVVFQIEVLRIAARRNETIKYHYKYQYHFYALLSLSGSLFFVLTLIGSFGNRLFGWQSFDDFFLAIRNIFAATAMFTFLAIRLFFYRNLLKLFDKIYQQRDHKLQLCYISQLKPLFESSLQLFPENFRFNPYEYELDAEAEWILDTVVNSLTEVRIRLWEVEACLRADKLGVEVHSLQVDQTTIKKEGQLWLKYLNSQESVEKALELSDRTSPPNAVPPMPDSNVYLAARYFSKLSNFVENVRPKVFQ